MGLFDSINIALSYRFVMQLNCTMKLWLLEESKVVRRQFGPWYSHLPVYVCLDIGKHLEIGVHLSVFWSVSSGQN
jgi:hypothetical protein